VAAISNAAPCRERLNLDFRRRSRQHRPPAPGAQQQSDVELSRKALELCEFRCNKPNDLYKTWVSLGRWIMTPRAFASSAPGDGVKNSAGRDGPSSETSVPYFAFSVKGHLTDSSPAPLSPRASDAMAAARIDESRREDHLLVAAAVCVPYFELSVLGCVRI
jgi:hypothetical protein